MPSPDTVLAGLTAAANDWRWLAIAWHLTFGASVTLAAAGWRPSARLLGCLLVAPLLSVSLIGWLSGNPFSGTVFAMLAAALVAAAVRFPTAPVTFASFAAAAPGLAIVVFGSTYPHFVRAESWLAYLYASPAGLLPCPTLSILIGGTLVFSNFRRTAWSAPLALTGLLYGAIGVFTLGVGLDLGLLLASAVLAVTIARDRCRPRSIRAADRAGDTSCPASYRAA
jgi:hypothetical protein